MKQGDLLFQTDPKPYQPLVEQASASVKKAEASLARADADVKRLRPLVNAMPKDPAEKHPAATHSDVPKVD
ncbi:hypothetical protein DES53_112129 [Roseimicrobium gellanilyticum]|uniref:Biotin/lipoyl-binding protein n=1 Tax=Roseimicrobium gellanilyticum TaxID=748857 RepID=A0A366H7I3_9BACT|nr:hypothetical protein [Roseimicrobium gellanilyticum]RBP38131.1 hypothetical protein DES53_112129 [Roseimicrobium gellanilyticum]